VGTLTDGRDVEERPESGGGCGLGRPAVVRWRWRSGGPSSMGTGEIAPAQHGETPSGRGLLQLGLHSSDTRGGRRCLTPAAAQGSARAAARAKGGCEAGLGHV
jgi:hypothetical protein